MLGSGSLNVKAHTRICISHSNVSDFSFLRCTPVFVCAATPSPNINACVFVQHSRRSCFVHHMHQIRSIMYDICERMSKRRGAVDDFLSRGNFFRHMPKRNNFHPNQKVMPRFDSVLCSLVRFSFLFSLSSSSSSCHVHEARLPHMRVLCDVNYIARRSPHYTN